MPCIINIDTSTEVCSVAVSEDGGIIFNRENREGPSLASLLGGYVKEAVDYISSRGLNIDAVAVSAGPGSYTGLRIGVSHAKGICFAKDIPLIAIETTKLMCTPLLFSDKYPDDVLLCPMIDARRMEVYSAVYNRALQYVEPLKANIIDESSFKELLDSNKILFFGNGAAKCKDVIKHDNAIFVDNIVPLATSMFPLAELAFRNEEFSDVAYFQPQYLKEANVTVAKNRVLQK